MKTLIVIPARYASTRYPGKPLVQLKGCDGKSRSLIQRSWEAACAVTGVDRVVIATDDVRIQKASAKFGGDVVMTSPDWVNGTERCAEAFEILGVEYDIIVNLQGDAPLTPAWFVEKLVEGLAGDTDADVATPVLRCDGAALNGFLDDRRRGRVGGTTAVFDSNNRAMFFSKEVIPFTGKSYTCDEATPVFHHVGVYAYRPEALKIYPTLPSGPLEKLEGLEQLRFMEQGRSVLCVEVQSQGRKFWELNNPEDVPRLESMMAEMGMV
ncbi:MAG: manno-octulosonate cytidylyltransferase [Paracoccaceae bacterium]